MQFTKEQLDIFKTQNHIKINAVAGSGKTTTVIEYAKTRPAGSKILYLAFNKSVKLEAIKKFKEKGIHNVEVETAHSLAYRHIVFKHHYKVKAQGYKTNEIVELLNLKSSGEKHMEYILANHINKFVSYFCNSDKSKIQELNYIDTVTDPIASKFVTKFHDHIVAQTRILLSKMDKGEIEIIHDFYLKKFQLSNPELRYDYILFDECQDASAAMLDIFSKQSAVKVIVGDTHQQIYGWRYAVNSLQKINCITYNLSTSFRFNQDIANLAMEILNYKNHIGTYQEIKINGNGTNKITKTKAVIARTNLGLLLKAIEYVTEKKDIKKIYFEGNINSYTYADDGTSLYDVLSLFNHNKSKIKDKLIKSMQSINELEDYIEKTEDVQLGMMIEIVKEYGNSIPKILKTIKDKHVENDDKEKAEMIFSTVHRCKGMEYDSIQLVNDFITEEKLKKINEKDKTNELILSKLNEEINLLYVAITRTKNSLYIPENLMPKDFPPSPQIHILKIQSEDQNTRHKNTKTATSSSKDNSKPDKAYSYDNIRITHKDAYKPWTAALDEELTVMYCEGINIKDMAKHFGRTRSSINMRIKKLDLAALYD